MNSKDGNLKVILDKLESLHFELWQIHCTLRGTSGPSRNKIENKIISKMQNLPLIRMW